ncbi:MAG TPA: CocE/NonD family hydrolase, partial [Candidatus Thermoplasmatota archaeon]|nr:CocE/NonD family hydrolase [Candidatus Thermoplasmatota archaeon]
LQWEGAATLGLSLLDGGGTTLCELRPAPVPDPRAGPDATTCTYDRVPATGDARAWTVRVSGEDVRDAEVAFEVTAFVEAFPPVGDHRLADVVAFEAPAPDATTLRGHVYLPTGEGPFPTILAYSPYWGAPFVPTGAFAFEADGERTLRAGLGLDAANQAGYAVALVNLRGTGGSDGCYQYGNHPVHGPDANAVIDALAARPWSDGSVGMHGMSYLAAVAYDAVASGPSPHLKAVVAVSGSWDAWNQLGSYGAAAEAALYHPGHRNREQGLGVTLSPYGGPALGTLRPQHWCEETFDPELAHYRFAVDGDKVGWFAERDLGERLRGKQVPFFATFGLDRGEGHARQVNGLWEVMPEPRRLVLGPWDHAPPLADWAWFTRAHALPWFDHFLRGGPPVPTEQVDYQDDAGTWRTPERWPPPGERVRLHLSGRTLEADPARVAASEHRMATNDANTLAPACEAHDAAVFVSAPIEADVVVAGNFLVNLTLTSTAPNGNVGAALWVVDADPCDAARTEPRWLQTAVSDLRHRGHLEVGEPFPVGAREVVALTSPPLAKTVPAGSRLALVVGAGVAGYVPKVPSPVLTLSTGPSIAGSIDLVVVDGELRFGTAQPR